MPPLARAALLALWLAASAGCGQMEPGVGVPLAATRTYTSYDARFSLRFPVDWAEVSRLTLPADTPFGAAGAGGRELLVAVTPLDAAPPDQAAMLETARSTFGDRLREAEVATLDGRPAVRVVGDATVEGRTVRLMQYLVGDRDRLYALTLRVPPEAFDAERGRLEAIAASFRLTD
jgi:hypothetical protein